VHSIQKVEGTSNGSGVLVTGFDISHITQLKRMFATLKTQVDCVLTNFENLCPILKSMKAQISMKLGNMFIEE